MNGVEAQRERSVGAPGGKLRGAEHHPGAQTVARTAEGQQWGRFDDCLTRFRRAAVAGGRDCAAVGERFLGWCRLSGRCGVSPLEGVAAHAVAARGRLSPPSRLLYVFTPIDIKCSNMVSSTHDC